MDNMVKYFIVVLSALISAFGLGGGNLYLLYLTLFDSVDQKVAQGKTLFLYLPCALISVGIYTYQKRISFSLIFPVILGGLLGSLLGAFLLPFVPTKWIRLVFGCFLFVQGFKLLFSKKKS